MLPVFQLLPGNKAAWDLNRCLFEVLFGKGMCVHKHPHRVFVCCIIVNYVLLYIVIDGLVVLNSENRYVI